MTPDRYRLADADAVIRRLEKHARIGAEVLVGSEDCGVGADGDFAATAFMDATRNAAASELANMAYRLALSCLSAHTQFCKHSLWTEVPQLVTDLHEAIRTLEHRLGRAASTKELPQPGAESDARPLLSAIDCCAQLEGESERVQYLRAQVPGIHDQWDEVARLARDLTDRATSRTWRRCARNLAAFAMIQKGDGHAALLELEALESELGVDRVLLFNRASGYALLGDQGAFERTAARFVACPPSDPEELGWEPAVKSKAPWFARTLSIETTAVLDAFGLEPGS